MLISNSLKLVQKDYAVKQRKTGVDLHTRCKHLEKFFVSTLRGVTLETLLEYVLFRREQKASNASINREIAVLRRAFFLSRTPWITGWEALPEAAPRQGRITPAAFDAILSCLPEQLAPLTCFLYYTGWRVSEALGLTWNDVDVARETVRLPARLSKSGKPRTIPMTAPVRDVIAELPDPGKLDEKLFGNIPYTTFYDAWCRARKRAGYPDALLHDFRRTAITRMVREAKLDRRTAMAFSGHATESAFSRYEVEDEEHMLVAAKRLSELAAKSVV